ncbi:unnamed protein product [Caenorhabditis sp. 36 PRJEB53466]|nr:unnamed protein product [Caenorhabditis sp. 36 PRJEB53466]
MDAAKLRVEGKKMIDIVADYWENIRSRKPLPDVKPGYITNLVPAHPPSAPEDWEKIYNDLEKVVWSGSTHWNHPHFFAYFPAGITYHSIMADILSSGLSSVGFSWIACPAITELEKRSLDWLVELMSLPEYFKNSHPGPGCGIIQSSGSDSILIAILTARASKVEQIKSEPTLYQWLAETSVAKSLRNLLYWHKVDRPSYDSTDVITPYYHDPTVFRNFVMYFCDQGHSSIEKGGMLAGVLFRKLKSTKGYLGNYGLDPDVLRSAIKEDRSRGYVPFMLVCTVGTTNTCAVDEVDKLGPICKKEGLYLHVDAAYAGSFAFCKEFKYLIKGLEYTDSYNLNLHKAGMINFDCSPLWFRNGTYASRYFNVDAVYLAHEYQSTGTDYRHLEVPLGRRFRSLKVWFTLRNLGVEKIREYQRNMCELALFFSKIIVEDGKFELFTPPHLGLATFRLKNHSNADNERLCTAINRDRRIHLVPATVKGIFILRISINSPISTEEDIRFAKKVIFEIANDLFKKMNQTDQKGTVRLKAFILLALATAVLATPTPATLDDRVTRVLTETAEKEWVSELVKRTSDGSSEANANEDLAENEQPPHTSMSTVEGEEEKFLECYSYDDDQCIRNGECAITKEICGADKHLKFFGCLAVFSWDKDDVYNETIKHVIATKKHIRKLGCMQFQDDQYMNCLETSRCVQEPPFRSGISMCCCTESDCNADGLISMKNPAFKDQSSSRDSFLWMTTPFSNQDVDSLDAYPIYWLVTLVLAGIFLAALVLLVIFAWKSQQKKKKRKFNTERTSVVEAGNTPLVDQTLLELLETPKPYRPPITDFKQIACGRFGRVYKAKWTENGVSRDVAVKKLKLGDKISFDAEKQIYDGLILLPKWYPGVLRYYYGDIVGNEYWIVTEFHERLSLYELITKNIISISSANRIILTMLDGLQFLHDDRPFFFGYPKLPIIHRDIKSKNVLVKRDMTACIADFGLARLYRFDIEASDLLGQVGTRRYMSPEVLEGATEFTANAFKSMDVYSMGLVTWEVITRTKLDENDEVPDYLPPYDKVGSNPAIGYMRNHVVSKKMRPPWRQEHRDHAHVSRLLRVAEEMWEAESYARITAGCAFARVWDIVKNPNDGSEGYGSSDSVKGKDSDDEDEIEVLNDEDEANDSEEEPALLPSYRPEDIEEMVKYHNSPETRAHPTPDPYLDNCPPIPPLPDISELGVAFPEPDGEEGEEIKEQTSSEWSPVEKIFDIQKATWFTKEQAEQEKEAEEVNTRASTPTPSGSL